MLSYLYMNIEVKKPGRKSTNKKAFDMLLDTPKGDFIVIKKKDWTIKTKPGQHLIRKRTGREFKVETLVDESGWKCTALN